MTLKQLDPPMIPPWFGRKYRIAYDMRRVIMGKTREQYIEVMKNMGIDDVCECLEHNLIFKKKRRRPETGHPGQLECTICGCLIWPHSSIYECDECTEPVLANEYPLPKNREFLCSECNGF